MSYVSLSISMQVPLFLYTLAVVIIILHLDILAHAQCLACADGKLMSNRSFTIHF